MGTAAFIIGILAIIDYAIGMIPGLRLFELVAIPLAVLGIVLGILGILLSSHVTLAIIGLILSGIAVFFGYARLMGHHAGMGGLRRAA